MYEIKLDISKAFPKGLHFGDWRRRVLTNLEATGMSEADAMEFIGASHIEGRPKSGQLFSAGTLRIITPLVPTNDQRIAIESSISEERGRTDLGPRLRDIQPGSYAGEIMYISDVVRKFSRGHGSVCYWDGLESWRKVSDDSVVKTFKRSSSDDSQSP